MAFVDVLDRELVALEFVLALDRIGPGARHGDADEYRVARRARRPGADRRTIRGKGRSRKRCGQGEPTGYAQAGTHEVAAAVRI